MDMIGRVKRTIQRYNLIKKGDCVVLGVSGGPDSIALLHILFSLRYELAIKLHVAHLNHQLRRGSKADQRFVVSQCEKLKLPYTVKALRKGVLKGSSIEESAREARFKFFIGVAQKQNARCIALGHTKDDLSETVLMRLIRGSGLMGMRGILPQRTIYGSRFIRPLFEVNRDQIEAFLARERIPFRIDPTNFIPKFFRNRIRLNLIPHLERNYNRNIRAILANLSNTLTQDYDYLENQAQQILKGIICSQNDHGLMISLDSFGKLHPALQRMILRLSVEELKGNINQITFDHLKEIDSLIKDRPEHSIVHLPGGLSVRKNKKYLIFKIR